MDQGATAFVLLSAAIASVCVPGAILLHTGRTRSPRSSVLPALIAVAVAGILWVLVGHAIVLGDTAAEGFVGLGGVAGIDPSLLGLRGLLETGSGGRADDLPASALQAVFAALAVALVMVSSAVRDRPVVSGVFASVWVAVVYFPLASWIFNVQWGVEGIVGGGWLVAGLADLVGVGALDFGGGLAVHVTAGASALALAAVSRRRPGIVSGIPGEPGSVIAGRSTPPSAGIPFVLLGGGMLWFGSVGLSAGAEGAADEIAALVVVNTLAAPAAASLSWLIVEHVRDGKPTARGAVTGAAAGLAAIAAGSAYLAPLGALVLGLVAGALAAVVVGSLRRSGGAGPTDVVGVHLTGGLLGSVFLGVAAQGTGVVYSGRIDQLLAQIIAAACVAGSAFVATWILASALRLGRPARFEQKRSATVAGGEAHASSSERS
ncbi:MAG: ammonia channel protein [Naasia sp.]